MPVDSYTCGKNLTNKYKIVLTDSYSTASSNLPEIIARLLLVSDQINFLFAATPICDVAGAAYKFRLPLK